jgi:hypothetical protein
LLLFGETIAATDELLGALFRVVIVYVYFWFYIVPGLVQTFVNELIETNVNAADEQRIKHFAWRIRLTYLFEIIDK